MSQRNDGPDEFVSASKLPQDTQDSQNTQDSQESLRDALYADNDVWVDEIDSVLQKLPAKIIDEEWNVNDGIYKKGNCSHPTNDEKYAKNARASYPSDTVQFAYFPSYYGASYWIPHVRSLWVEYGTDWTPDRDADGGGFSARANGPTAFHGDNPRKQSKYMVGGVLVETLVTNSLDRVVEHVEEQLELVADRVLFNLEIERIAARGQTNDGRPRHQSPVRVSGVGEKNTKKLARRFGAYSNIIHSDATALSHITSSSWGNQPSGAKILNRVERAVTQYRTQHRNGDVKSSQLPEDLQKFPQKQPDHRMSEQEEDTSPLGCIRGGTSELTKLGAVRSVTLRVRGDGYWHLTPSGDGAGEFTLLVPFGAESQEVNHAQQTYTNTPENTYYHDVYVVLQMLEQEWERAHSKDTVDWTVDSRTTPIQIPNQAVDTQVQSLRQSVRQHLEGQTEWAPTVLMAEYFGNRAEPRLEYLLDCLSREMAEDWSVKVKSTGRSRGTTLQLRYRPDTVRTTSWIRETSEIQVEYTDSYPSASDVDEADSPTTSEKYVISGVLANPMATRSIGRAIAHLEQQFNRVAKLTRFNAAIECLSQQEESLRRPDSIEDILDPDTQQSVLSQLSGIGSGSERSLANEYGTYLDLLLAEELTVNLSHHYTDGLETLQETIHSNIGESVSFRRFVTIAGVAAEFGSFSRAEFGR